MTVAGPACHAITVTLSNESGQTRRRCNVRVRSSLPDSDSVSDSFSAQDRCQEKVCHRALGLTTIRLSLGKLCMLAASLGPVAGRTQAQQQLEIKKEAALIVAEKEKTHAGSTRLARLQSITGAPGACGPLQHRRQCQVQCVHEPV